MGLLAESGIYEFVFGNHVSRRDELIQFWHILGFEVEQEGQLSAAEAGQFYGHAADLVSLRLRHTGCNTYNTGLVRLQLWSECRNQGLGTNKPIEIGSRWMGMYTNDILQLRDSFGALGLELGEEQWMSELISAPLAHPEPAITLEQPFLGLRETLIFNRDVRLAFIQRGGFERPGFGTINNDLPYKNSEGSHANIIQPSSQFNTEFYKQIFDFETAPFGDAHDSGHEPPTKLALRLESDETFHVERIRAQECPSGLLQVYSSHVPKNDLIDLSQAGSSNLCLYSFKVTDMGQLQHRLHQYDLPATPVMLEDEFSELSMYFQSPDGYHWLAVA